MKFLKTLIAATAFLFTAHSSFGQDLSMLNPLPSTKEEFVKSEPSIISVADWLENTPLNQDPEKRRQMNALLLAWLTNSPTVTISLDGKVAPMSRKNPELLGVFMAGWMKYTLQNAYANDPVKCNLAGIKSVLKVYKMDGAKKDKEIEKYVALDAGNQLESWIADNLGKK